MKHNEKHIIPCAVRGRAKSGSWYESEHFQKLEPRFDGLSNSVTTVAKDNMILEVEIKRNFLNIQ